MVMGVASVTSSQTALEWLADIEQTSRSEVSIPPPPLTSLDDGDPVVAAFFSTGLGDFGGWFDLLLQRPAPTLLFGVETTPNRKQREEKLRNFESHLCTQSFCFYT